MSLYLLMLGKTIPKNGELPQLTDKIIEHRQCLLNVANQIFKKSHEITINHNNVGL